MSPAVLGRGLTYQRFPRVSGDEPAIQALEKAGVEFSPRERG